jgi:hypothetical protein
VRKRFGQVSSAVVFAAAVVVSSSAIAQLQNKDQQKCINTLNKDACKVAAAAGKNNTGCVKAATKGTATSNCVLGDASGKIGPAQTKTLADESKNHCDGVNAPTFGYGGAAAASGAAVEHETKLFADTYGSIDPTAVISTVKADAKCQSAVTKDVEKVIATKWKQYLKCKKTALATATSAAALEACANGLDADPKVGATVAKLNADIGKSCAPPVDINGDLHGKCLNETVATLAACMDRLAECHICFALNQVDGLNLDCDLFDDGLANGTCGILMHKCVLGGGIANSYVKIYSAAFPVPISFDSSGSSIDVGGSGGAAGCRVQNFNPINVASIGTICIQPASGCPGGARYCGPGAPGSGPAFGIDYLSDGNVGACSSNAACIAACITQCPIEYAGHSIGAAGCVGYCTKGTQQACTTDAQCAALGQGSCNGPDNPGANANTCQCGCVDPAAFGGSDPGDLQCQLGARLTVESAPPCDGTDTLINVGDACIPLTTQRAHGRIDDANFAPGSTVPGPMPGPNTNDQSGVPIACATLDASTTTGLSAVGVVNFFGSSIGDLSVGLKATCN